MTTSINIFRRASETVAFAAGDVIFSEGDPGDVAYGIQEGTVAILRHGKVIDTAGPGSIIGEMALIDSKPRSASAAAQTDCKLVPVDEKRFMYLVQETPFFALNVMRIMTERIRRFLEDS